MSTVNGLSKILITPRPINKINLIRQNYFKPATFLLFKKKSAIIKITFWTIRSWWFYLYRAPLNREWIVWHCLTLFGTRCDKHWITGSLLCMQAWPNICFSCIRPNNILSISITQELICIRGKRFLAHLHTWNAFSVDNYIE